MGLQQAVEVASGVDAFYLSAAGTLPQRLLGQLSEARSTAQGTDEPVLFELGGELWTVGAGAFGKYPFRLEHPYGLVGVTGSGNLPPVRVQPRADYLHGVGPEVAAGWFMLVLSEAFGGSDGVAWSVARLDLFCDVQGWELTAADKDRFVSRASARVTFEDGERLTGFTFGKRGGKVHARIYDKTVEAGGKGSAAVWADRWALSGQYMPGAQVWRVEFELDRAMVRELVDGSPEDVLDGRGGVWGYLADEWLTFRSRGEDSNRSRWPLADEWRVVQAASLRGEALGLDRVRESVLTHRLASLVPGLRGYVSSVGALMDSANLADAMEASRSLIARSLRHGDRSFEDLMWSKREAWGLT
jgi:hypothetical protein